MRTHHDRPSLAQEPYPQAQTLFHEQSQTCDERELCRVTKVCVQTSIAGGHQHYSGDSFSPGEPLLRYRCTVRTLLRALSGGYVVLASVYCLAAFNSYTYLFLVKAPPYAWLSWFVFHGPLLFWIAFAAAVISSWPYRRSKMVAAGFLALALIGLGITAQNIPANLTNTWSAYVWSLILLLPLLVTMLGELQVRPARENPTSRATLFSYSNGVVVAVLAFAISELGVLAHTFHETRTLSLHVADGELMILVLAGFLWVTVLILTLLNLIQLIAQRITSCPMMIRRWTTLFFVMLGFDLSIFRFLNGTLGFRGWPVQLYAGVLAAYLALWGYLLLSPIFRRPKVVAHASETRLRTQLPSYAICLAVLTGALAAPTVVGDTDWNGILTGTFGLVLLIVLSVCVYALRAREKNYSAPAVIAVLLLATVSYWGLSAASFLWAKSLSASEGGVDGSLEAHEAQNASFRLIRGLLDRRADDSCDEYCHALRQYTNIQNARAPQPLRLLDNLTPTQGPRPNIFIIVVDSLRPDYLGAYNPAVDFTPNLDALAADSVVMRNAFTQYAGTSLSEPAIWSGALLLHARYMRPFENVNSLRTLARTDGYELVVSYDHILRKLLAPDEPVIKLDAEKRYNEIELSSTLQQLESYLDTRPDRNRPVLFYTQPMNVHILGVNHLEERTSSNWRSRPGFNDRIGFKLHQVDDFIGSFVAYLKARGMYENSVVVITSDHGEATPELAGLGLLRRGHSVILFPEVMRVPLIVHVPRSLRKGLVYDESRLAALTDITPSLYYLLGHRPIKSNMIVGQSIFATSAEELQQRRRDHLLLASDARAAYGLLIDNGRQMYVAYDSPPRSMLFDLVNDPKGIHNVLTDALKIRYDRQILDDLQSLAAFYDYKPDGGSSAPFSWDR